tara:strand:+ start:279 stop:578 length:300 start_codon:yes stop_codon:yes gene_type:complete
MSTEIQLDETIKEITLEPGKFNVVLLNDDATPMEWVMDVLKTIFKHSNETAEALTLTVHTEGAGIAGTYVYEVAEQKAVESVNASRERGFPLQLRVDAE